MRRHVSLVVLLSLLSLMPAAAEGQATPPLSLPEYVARLDRLLADVAQLDDQHADRAAPILADVPAEWRVAGPNRTFEVQADWLRRDLDAWRRRPDAGARARLLERLRLVRADAASYAAPGAPVDSSDARARLTSILADREFRGLHGPTWLDRLRQRALALLLRLLGRVLGSSAIPTITNVLVYVLIGLVVLLVAVWAYRTLRRSATLDTIFPDHIPELARPWTVWLADARDAAAQGHWHQAVRLAYWCAISFLEGQGAWRPDRSRTPREYLRLLPAASAHGPQLKALTRLLEHVWYGTQPADAARFDEALAELKKLGCPPV
jgi:hypothetical protein